ncbi:SDR family oxidoreductase [Nocardiopsis rhodophaea]
MRVLVLGGTRYVGRAVVEAAMARGYDVTVLNRGVSGSVPEGVESLLADRTDPGAMGEAIGARKWDAVVDTWVGAPKVIGASCALLADRVGHFGYVSSWAVYRAPVPFGGDESAPVVDGDPDDEKGEDLYPTVKRGNEIAVQRVFGDRALIARPGPMLGPHEDVGSLGWWLRRIHRGGKVLAPGNPADPFQFVDVRDHAVWMLDAANRGVGGTLTTVCARGRYTMGELFETIRSVTRSDAELVWVPDDKLLAAGIRPYLDIPLWLPAAMRGGFNDLDASAAQRAGLDTSRPLSDTLTDTWSWLERDDEPLWRNGNPARGLDPDIEQRLLDEVA